MLGGCCGLHTRASQQTANAGDAPASVLPRVELLAVLESGELTSWAREVAKRHDPRVSSSTPVHLMAPPEVLTRPTHLRSVRVLLCGGVAVRIHPEGTRGAELARRLDTIESPELDRYWLLPLSRGVLPAPGGLYGTVWPRATLLSTLETPPWADAGRLLGHLHTAPIDTNLQRHGGITRFQRALSQAHDLPTMGWLAHLGSELEAEVLATNRRTLVHGHWHLGHLGHPLLSKRWRLLDVDDLGLGDPLWDLALPAGYVQAGLVAASDWELFLSAYCELAPTPDMDKLALLAKAALLVSAVNALSSTPPQSADTILKALQND